LFGSFNPQDGHFEISPDLLPESVSKKISSPEEIIKEGVFSIYIPSQPGINGQAPTKAIFTIRLHWNGIGETASMVTGVKNATYKKFNCIKDAILALTALSNGCMAGNIEKLHPLFRALGIKDAEFPKSLAPWCFSLGPSYKPSKNSSISHNYIPVFPALDLFQRSFCEEWKEKWNEAAKLQCTDSLIRLMSDFQPPRKNVPIGKRHTENVQPTLPKDSRPQGSFASTAPENRPFPFKESPATEPAPSDGSLYPILMSRAARTSGKIRSTTECSITDVETSIGGDAINGSLQAGNLENGDSGQLTRKIPEANNCSFDIAENSDASDSLKAKSETSLDENTSEAAANTGVPLSKLPNAEETDSALRYSASSSGTSNCENTAAAGARVGGEESSAALLRNEIAPHIEVAPFSEHSESVNISTSGATDTPANCEKPALSVSTSDVFENSSDMAPLLLKSNSISINAPISGDTVTQAHSDKSALALSTTEIHENSSVMAPPTLPSKSISEPVKKVLAQATLELAESAIVEPTFESRHGAGGEADQGSTAAFAPIASIRTKANSVSRARKSSSAPLPSPSTTTKSTSAPPLASSDILSRLRRRN